MVFLPPVVAAATAAGTASAAAGTIGFTISTFSFTTVASWALFGASIAYSLLNRPKPVTAEKPENIGGFRSAVGKYIPIPYGVIPVEGLCVDLDFRPEQGFPYERKDRTGTGGKVYSWEYRANWITLVCEKPVSEILKIWLNDTLVFDITGDATDEFRAASKKLLEPKPLQSNPEIDWTSDWLEICTGDQTEANAYFKALRGDDYPIYKGSTYIVFHNWLLTYQYGNAIPQVKVLVSTEALTVVNEITEATYVGGFDTKNKYQISNLDFAVSDGGPTATWASTIGTLHDYQTYTSYFSDKGQSWDVYSRGIEQTPVSKPIGVLNTFKMEDADGVDTWFSVYQKSDVLKSISISYHSVGSKSQIYELLPPLGYTNLDYPLFGDGASACYFNGYVYLLSTDPALKLFRIAFDPSDFRVDYKPTVSKIIECGDSGLDSGGVYFEMFAIDSGMYVLGGTFISPNEDFNLKCHKFNGATLEFDEINTDITSGLGFGSGSFVLCATSKGEYLYALVKDTTDGNCKIIRSADGLTWSAYLPDVVIDGTDYSYYGAPCMGFYSEHIYILGGGGTSFKAYKIKPTKNLSSGFSSPDIIQDIADRVGYTGTIESDDIDADSVLGYVIDRWTTGKEAIEPLQKVFLFDVVFHDGKMECVKRGVRTPVVLTEDKFGWSVEGSRQEKLKFNFKTRKNLPRETIVQYIDPELNYQQNNQKAERSDLFSPSSNILDFPLSLDKDVAKTTAAILVDDMIMNTKQVNFSLSDGYSYLLPGDLIQSTINEMDYTIRISSMSIEEGTCNCAGVLEDTTLYSRVETAGTNIRTDYNENILRSNLIVNFLDIPRVNPTTGDYDGGDGYGFYITASPMNWDMQWSRAVVRYWDVKEAAWMFKTFIDAPSVIGTVPTALGTITNPWIIDNKNSIEVIVSGNLSTNEATMDELNRHKNLCLVGNELIQFKKATLIDDEGRTNYGYYLLEGLMRGLFGTERYCDTHEDNEKFVMLENRAYVPLTSEEANKDILYRVISLDDQRYVPTEMLFNCTSVAKRCLSPTQVVCNKLDNGDFYIEWMGRVRGVVGWFSAPVTRPSGEPVEYYEIEFLSLVDDSVVFIQEIRVVHLDSGRKPRFIFPVNGYTVDGYRRYGQADSDVFGAEQDYLKFRIYQINEVGRGFGVEYNSQTGTTSYI